MKDFSAIILAAGNGTRYGKPKQHEFLKEKRVWQWSFDTLKPLVSDIVVVGIDCPGGENRMESVKIGLEKINSKYVLIHDSARPLVKAEDIERLKSSALGGAKSATLCMPIKDLILEKNNTVKYLNRDTLLAAATPQIFDTELLKKAYQNAGNYFFDDCSLVQKIFGIEPALIISGQHLQKITYPEDLKILESLC